MKITIVALAAAHAADIEDLAADPAVAATCNLPHPYPSGGGDRFVRDAQRRWREGSSRVFAILAGGRVAGVVSLNAIDLAAARCQVDYWVGRPYWGAGVASAAVGAALAHAREVLGLRNVESACLHGNPASRRVLVKNGLRAQGRVVNDGRWGRKHLGAEMVTFAGSLTGSLVESQVPVSARA